MNTVSVAGLDFNTSKLETIKLRELQGKILSPGHLFYYSDKFKKYFLMMRAGELLTQEFIDKQINRGIESFKILRSSDPVHVGKYKNWLNRLKDPLDTYDLLEVKQNIVDDFLLKSIKGEYLGSRLDFITACYEVFRDDKNKKILDGVYEQSALAFNRSLQMGGYAIPLLLMMEYVDFQFLKEVYQVLFLLDCSLFETGMEHNFTQASELENQRAGRGLKFLKSKSEKKWERFISHPLKGFLKAKRDYQHLFSFPNILKVVKKHHERANGSGFPHALENRQIRDWESIVILMDYLIDYSEVDFMPEDNVHAFSNLLERKLKTANLHEINFKRILTRIFSHLTREQKNRIFKSRVL